jgi:hypothetical protein
MKEIALREIYVSEIAQDLEIDAGLIWRRLKAYIAEREKLALSRPAILPATASPGAAATSASSNSGAASGGLSGALSGGPNSQAGNSSSPLAGASLGVGSGSEQKSSPGAILSCESGLQSNVSPGGSSNLHQLGVSSVSATDGTEAQEDTGPAPIEIVSLKNVPREQAVVGSMLVNFEFLMQELCESGQTGEILELINHEGLRSILRRAIDLFQSDEIKGEDGQIPRKFAKLTALLVSYCDTPSVLMAVFQLPGFQATADLNSRIDTDETKEKLRTVMSEYINAVERKQFDRRAKDLVKKFRNQRGLDAVAKKSDISKPPDDDANLQLQKFVEMERVMRQARKDKQADS